MVAAGSFEAYVFNADTRLPITSTISSLVATRRVLEIADRYRAVAQVSSAVRGHEPAVSRSAAS
jgi:hypothetical protein